MAEFTMHATLRECAQMAENSEKERVVDGELIDGFMLLTCTRKGTTLVGYGVSNGDMLTGIGNLAATIHGRLDNEVARGITREMLHKVIDSTFEHNADNQKPRSGKEH